MEETEPLSDVSTGRVHEAASSQLLRRSLERFERAHTTRSVVGLREAFHDDALIETVSSKGLALGADETVEAIRVALADGVYEMGDWHYEELAQSVALLVTGVRYRVSISHVRHDTVYRLITGKDGRIWRGMVFRNHAEAVTHYKITGHDLGMARASSGG